jgi:hypothetical protein
MPTLTQPVSAADVVDPVRVHLAQVGVFEVMHPNPIRVAGRAPLRASVVDLPDELLLLGVHTDHRLARR